MNALGNWLSGRQFFLYKQVASKMPTRCHHPMSPSPAPSLVTSAPFSLVRKLEMAPTRKAFFWAIQGEPLVRVLHVGKARASQNPCRMTGSFVQ